MPHQKSICCWEKKKWFQGDKSLCKRVLSELPAIHLHDKKDFTRSKTWLTLNISLAINTFCDEKEMDTLQRFIVWYLMLQTFSTMDMVDVIPLVKRLFRYKKRILNLLVNSIHIKLNGCVLLTHFSHYSYQHF